MSQSRKHCTEDKRNKKPASLKVKDAVPNGSIIILTDT